MSRTGIPLVRNTIGVIERFSVQKYVATVVGEGGAPRPARRDGRRLLRDARRARARIITTDDIRQWREAQDPLVFAHRRTVRERQPDGSWRWVDPRLGRIAALAEAIAPTNGRILTELFIDYFRPGGGEVLFRSDDDTPAPTIEELKEKYGGLGAADAFLVPGDPDFSKPGETGTAIELVDDPRKRFLYYIYPDNAAARNGFQPGRLPRCRETWLFRVEYMRTAKGCRNVPYKQYVDEGKLHAFDEAIRICRTTKCPAPVPTIKHLSWNCDEDLAHIIFLFEVDCRARIF